MVAAEDWGQVSQTEHKADLVERSVVWLDRAERFAAAKVVVEAVGLIKDLE